MGNIGKRERYYLMLLGIVIAVLLIYYFGIRNLGIKYDEMVDTRSQLQAQLDYYEALKTQNDEALSQINTLKNNISTEESRFLPYISAESIEQYVLKTFEDSGCPYLVSVTASDVAAPGVTLPDGSSATDALLIKRITVQYSTTDGFCIPEYNRSATVVVDGQVDEAAFNALLDEMYWHGADSIVGYDEFVSALESIEAANPDCIKINSISITSESGYILMNADIDFYSVSFNSRVSEPDTSAPYVTWAGPTSINTEAGFIGYPFIVENPASEWFNIMMTDDEATEGSRPFATYYSAAIFEESVINQGLAATLDVGAAPAPEEIPEE